jgi:hypothetical protein
VTQHHDLPPSQRNSKPDDFGYGRGDEKKLLDDFPCAHNLSWSVEQSRIRQEADLASL